MVGARLDATGRSGSLRLIEAAQRDLAAAAAQRPSVQTAALPSRKSLTGVRSGHDRPLAFGARAATMPRFSPPDRTTATRHSTGSPDVPA